MSLTELVAAIEAKGLDFTIIKDTAGFTGEIVYTLKVTQGGCMPANICAAQGYSLQWCIDQVAAGLAGKATDECAYESPYLKPMTDEQTRELMLRATEDHRALKQQHGGSFFDLSKALKNG